MGTQVDSLQNILIFLEKLKIYDEKTLTVPIEPGKWSVREIIGHLYYWDSYLIESMIPHIAEGAILPPFPNPAVYNRAAIASLEGRRVFRILDGFIKGRKWMIEQLAIIDNQVAFTVRGSEEMLTTMKLVEMFSEHDKHHQEQMANFISTNLSNN